MPPPSQRTKQDIRLAHIKQLAGLDVHAPLGAPRGPRDDAPSPTADDLLPILLGWINDNPAAVKAAKEAREFYLHPCPDVHVDASGGGADW